MVTSVDINGKALVVQVPAVDEEVLSSPRLPLGGEERVELSAKGCLLARNGLFSPTSESVRALKEELFFRIGKLFREGWISGEPPLSWGLDSDGRLLWRGEPTDPRREVLQQVMEEEPGLGRLIHATLSLGEQVRIAEERGAFQQEYGKAEDPRAVVAKYAYLFDERVVWEGTLTVGERSLSLSFRRAFSRG